MIEHTLQLFDTMQRKELPVTPSNGKTIRIYTCGPTVYDVAHIGNFRTFLFEDLLRRTLKLFGYKVFQVMNITDVDDKTIARATENKISLAEYTETFTRAFFEDLNTLRIQPAEKHPRATDHINEMLEMIQILVEKKAAYVHTDGSVYFAINQAKEYGKLSHLKLEDLKSSASQHSDEYSSAADFALWKAYDPERDGEVYWESTWGKGRPGWHLECSVMAKKYLGDTIDLHAGGVDLIFPHHENEIAQSETSTGKPFALHWAHAEHLLVDNKKMSKKLGNFYTLRDLLEKGYSPSAIRFFLMSTHYRTQLNFTMQGLDAALASIKRIRDFADRLKERGKKSRLSEQFKQETDEHEKRFFQALAKDLNINEALGALFDWIRHSNLLLDQHKLSAEDKHLARSFLDKVDSVLDILTSDETSLPEEVTQLLTERSEARKQKDWARSDTLREQLEELGYHVEDMPSGQRVSKKSPNQ